MSKHIKNNQSAQEAIHRFLHKIKYQAPQGSLSTVFEIVSSIFESAGQKYLLYLIKLRKYWLEQKDQFLAQHAYPQNFSISREMTITPKYLKLLELEATLSPTILEQLQQMQNLSFTKKNFLNHLQRHLKRDLTDAEQAVLLDFAPFKVKEIVLHLIVYDGAFTQAIHFEMDTYLKQINAILEDIRVDRIECHVGDLGQKRQDQIWVGKLTQVWETLVPPHLKDCCVPAFIQRTNYHEATLVVYVSKQTFQAHMRNSPQKQALLSRIYQQFPKLQWVIQKVDFLVQQGMNPKQIRANSLLMGESAYDPLSSYDRLKQLIQQHTAPSDAQKKKVKFSGKKPALTPKEHLQAVQEIIQRMKKTADPSPPLEGNPADKPLSSDSQSKQWIQQPAKTAAPQKKKVKFSGKKPALTPKEHLQAVQEIIQRMKKTADPSPPLEGNPADKPLSSDSQSKQWIQQPAKPPAPQKKKVKFSGKKPALTPKENLQAVQEIIQRMKKTADPS